MKKIITALIVFTLTLSYNYSSALPTYTLEAKNFVLVAPNQLEWEIYLTHTNTETLEYAGGQYLFNFNPAIANGGTINFKVAQDSSDIIRSMRPRNPSTLVMGTVLQIGSNILPGPGNGISMSSTYPGTRIIRLKLTTTASEFANVPFNLGWRNPPTSIATKINAYIETTNTDITTPATHIMNFTLATRYNIKYAIEGYYNPALDIHSKAQVVTAYLRNINAPYDMVDSDVDLMDAKTLYGSFHFKNAPDGNYYLIIKQSNSIETWSKTGGEVFISGGEHTYDFTSSSSQAYVDNMRLMGSRYCFYTGEVNQDFIIDISDMSMVDNDSYHLISGEVITDLNGDNVVDLQDMVVIDNNRFRLTKSPLTGY